jgi:hypothetical protein
MKVSVVIVNGPAVVLIVGALISCCPSSVRAAEMSVKIAFQVAEAMTLPGKAFSAPVYGV